jgi:putative peptidoglycan lipid II flippase
MRATLASGMKLVAFLTVPSMIGLIALREPIVRLLFERGRFHASDTIATAQATLMYAFGLYAYSAVKVVAPAFYALDKPRVPLYGSLSAVAANLILNVSMFPVLSYLGLALGTALAATINFAFLVFWFRRLVGFPLAPLVAHLCRVLLAAVPCGAAAWAVTVGLEGALGLSLPAQVLAVAVGIGAGGAVYVGACRLLRVDEIDELFGVVRRRLGRGKA